VRHTIALATAGLLTMSTACVTAAWSSPAGASASTGHQQAVTEAKGLRAIAPTVSDATRVSASPVKRLDTPPSAQIADTLVERDRFWTVNEPVGQVFHDLTAQAVPDTTDAGQGSAGGPKPGDTVDFAAYSPDHLPAGITYGQLVLAVTADGAGESAIGVYGEAIPTPPRPADEVVPTSEHQTQVALQTHETHVSRRNTVDGAAARKLVRAFNQLTVVPPGEPPVPCPVNNGRALLASFHAHGHTIVATAGVCPFVTVTRDGKDIKPLTDSSAFDKDIGSDLAPKPTRFRSKRPRKPASEVVPHSVHKARLARREVPYTKDAAYKTVTGKRAKALVAAFDRMKTEPTNSVHCDIAGGPEVLVTFRTAKHKWLVRQAACTDIVVTRDGKSLPTLISDTAWEHAVSHDLGT
jgi:hypothetical protein